MEESLIFVDTPEAEPTPSLSASSEEIFVASPPKGDHSESWTLLDSFIDVDASLAAAQDDAPPAGARSEARRRWALLRSALRAGGARAFADDDDGLADEELSLEAVSQRLGDLERSLGDLTSSELLRRLSSGADDASPTAARQIASFLADGAPLPSEAVAEADGTKVAAPRVAGRAFLAVAVVLAAGALGASYGRGAAAPARVVPGPALEDAPFAPEAPLPEAAPLMPDAAPMMPEASPPPETAPPPEEAPPRGRRSATKDAYRSSHREDRAFVEDVVRATAKEVEAQLGRAAAAVERFGALDVDAELRRAAKAADGALAYVANATVDGVAADVARAFADPPALPKLLAGATMGLGGLLVGVPFVPGVTDNLLVGLAGAILPFVGRDEAE